MLIFINIFCSEKQLFYLRSINKYTMQRISGYNTEIYTNPPARLNKQAFPAPVNTYSCRPAFSGNLKSAATLLGELNAKQNNIKKITLDEIYKLEDFYNYFDRDFLIMLGTAKHFGEENIEKLFKHLIENTDDVVNFVSLMAGQKPSVIFSHKYTPILESGHYNGFDVVTHKTPNSSFVNSFILNPEQCKPLIEKYKSLFTSKMMLLPEISTDGIYKQLISRDSVLFKGDFCFSDITGILLGFPVKNSLLYNLEAMLPQCEYRNFSNILRHRRELQYNLAHQNYSSITLDIKELAIKAISEYTGSEFKNYNLSELPGGGIPGIKYITHIREPEEEARLIKAFRKTLEKFEEIISQKETSLS